MAAHAVPAASPAACAPACPPAPHSSPPAAARPCNGPTSTYSMPKPQRANTGRHSGHMAAHAAPATSQAACALACHLHCVAARPLKLRPATIPHSAINACAIERSTRHEAHGCTRAPVASLAACALACPPAPHTYPPALALLCNELHMHNLNNRLIQLWNFMGALLHAKSHSATFGCQVRTGEFPIGQNTQTVT